MRIVEHITKEKLQECFKGLDSYLDIQNPCFVKYLDLGCKVVRLVGLSDEFLGHIKKQLTFVLRDNADKFDATIVLFKDNIKIVTKKIHRDLDPARNFSLRIELLALKEKITDVIFFDDTYSQLKPVFFVEPERGFFNAYDEGKNTYYYGVKNLDPEEFIKEGHLFVQQLNKIWL